MMKYFAIEYSLNGKLMGKIPQIKEIIHHCHVNDEPNFIDQFYFRKIDTTPILSNAVLYANAKQTDLIHVDGIGFSFGSIVISDKLKRIFEQFNCYGLQYFSTYIIQKNQKVNDYWQTHIYKFAYQYVDFDKTNFTLKDRDINRKMVSEEINFNNIDDFLSFTNQISYPKMISFKDISFNKDMDLDFFTLRYTEGGHNGIVSERLKNEIEKQEITGIEFRPIELPLAEWLQQGERDRIYGKSY